MKIVQIVFFSMAILILLIVGLAIYKYYPYLEAYYYNTNIDVSGIKLMMGKDDLSKTLGQQGEFINGMGGDGLRYSDKGIFVGISNHGLFKQKVSQIDTENPDHSILGISVGEDYEKAISILKKYGFKKTNDIFEKGNVFVQLFGGSKISMIRIYIEDPAYKGVQW